MKKIYKRTLSIVLTVVMITMFIPFIGLQFNASAANPFSQGQCTWYAYKRWTELLGYEPAIISGNAGGWYDNCVSKGFSRGSTPQVGAIICWNNGVGTDAGHVAIVESVSSSSITVSEYNWNVSLGYGTRTISLSNINCASSSRPNRYCKGYIYLPGNPAPTGNNPQGVLDYILADKGQITIAGWGFDRDDLSASVEVRVYIGDECHTGIISNEERPHVNQQYPGVGNYHGFSAIVPTDKYGSQTVSVYLINIGGGSNVLLDSRELNIPYEYSPPQISNIAFGNNSDTELLITCRITDNVKPTLAQFAVWTENTGISAARWYDGNLSKDANGYFAWCQINFSDFNGYNGLYYINIYAQDGAGNTTIYPTSVYINNAPQISNIAFGDISNTGVLITCRVTDNAKPTLAQFAVWTENMDINAARWYDGNLSTDANGYFAWCRINSSDFNGYNGLYYINIYAQDGVGNTTIHPTSVYIGNRHTVTFNSTGGNYVNSITITEYAPYGSLPTPERKGYTFDGWYTSSNGGTNIKKDTKVTITEDQTLYAHWQHDTFKVKENENIKMNGKTIYGANLLCMTESELSGLFENSNVFVLMKTDRISTGTTVNLIDDTNTVYDTLTVCIFGDTNCDGWYNGMDSIIVNCIANGLLSKEQVGEAVYMAADCNHDGAINELDVELLEEAGLLLASVDQSKSEEELQTNSVYVQYLNLIEQNPVNEDTQTETQPEQTPSALDKLIGFIADIYAFLNNLINFIKTIFA